jgi:hypothetical protein
MLRGLRLAVAALCAKAFRVYQQELARQKAAAQRKGQGRRSISTCVLICLARKLRRELAVHCRLMLIPVLAKQSRPDGILLRGYLLGKANNSLNIGPFVDPLLTCCYSPLHAKATFGPFKFVSVTRARPMSGNDQAKKQGGGYYTNVRDQNLVWSKRGLNARVTMIVVGVDDDPNAPHAAVVWVNSGPGDPLRGRHLHRRDAINLVVEGAMYLDGHWLRPGQAKIVPAGVKYGDATTSSEGVIFLGIF